MPPPQRRAIGDPRLDRPCAPPARRAASDGAVSVDRRLSGIFAPYFQALEFTAFECAYYIGVVTGKTDAQIGATMGLRLNTVESYLKRLDSRLGSAPRRRIPLDAVTWSCSVLPGAERWDDAVFPVRSK